MRVHKVSAFKYLLDPPGYQLEMIQKGQKINLIKLGKNKLYLFYSQEAVKEVLLTNAKYLDKGMALTNLRNILGDNVLTSDGPAHQKQRQSLSKVFSKAFIKDFEIHIDELMQEHLARHPEKVYNIEKYFTEISMNVASVLLFGKKLDQEISTIRESLNDILKVLAFMTIPGYKKLLWLPLPHHKRYRHAIKQIQVITQSLIDTRKKNPQERIGVLDILLANNCSPSEIQAHMVALFLAGHETTATALTWILYIAVRDNLITEEIVNEFSECHEKQVSYVDIDQYPIIQAFIYEMLRLYPSIWNIGRKVNEDIEIDGIKLNKGDVLSISPYATQRDPSYYENPNQFDHTRWLDENGSLKQMDKFAYFPFSYGSRNCIGKVLAETQIFIILKNIIPLYEFKLISPNKVNVLGRISLKPSKKIYIEFKRRSSSK